MSSNKTIFTNKVFDLPIQSEFNYLDGIKLTFEQFLTSIGLFTGDIKSQLDPNIKVIEDQCIAIIETTEMFLKGFPGEAYFHLKKCLDKLNAMDLLEVQQTLTTTEKGNLYRVRIDQKSQLEKGGIFHIPFNMREKVATQRYSIPGLPCLYLGDSLFVCWEELGRPDLDAIHASRFDLAISNFKLLNLNINTNEIRKRCFPGTKEKFIPHLIKFLSYWPLLSACSFIVRKPLDVFKPEYIIPQLVMQWVAAEGNVDGLKYKSNRIAFGPNNVGSFTNVVIPVKEISSSGFCNVLSKKIKFTTPISWSLLEASDPKHDFLKNDAGDIKIDALRRASYIEIIDGERTIYANSKFGILEEKLKTLTPTLFF